MEKEKIDFNDLIINSNDLLGALQGLENYIFYNFSMVDDIKRENLGELSGLVAAIKVLANKHSREIQEFE